jgi:predicted nucleic acid-binding protein
MICVDASVVTKWLFNEDLSAKAEALFRDASRTAERLVAPPLLPIEITNMIRQRTRRAKPPALLPLSAGQARQALEFFLTLPIDLSHPSPLHRQALELAIVHELRAAYDAYYLALAQILRCPLWTADWGLVDAVQGELPFVHWLGDYLSN